MARKKKAAKVITEEEGRKRLERINQEYEEAKTEIEAEFAKPIPKHRNLWAHTLQLVVFESTWRNPDDVAREQLLAEEEKKRQWARERAEKIERGLHRPADYVAPKKVEIVKIDKSKPAEKTLNADEVMAALLEDREQLIAAAQKVQRNKKKYLAEIQALFDAALEKDIVKRSTLEIIRTDIERLEKKLKAEPIMEGPEVNTDMPWDYRYADEVIKGESFEEEQRRIKAAERKEIAELQKKFQGGTIKLSGRMKEIDI